MLKQDNAASSFSTQNHMTMHSDMCTIASLSWVFAAHAFEINIFKHIQTDPEFLSFGLSPKSERIDREEDLESLALPYLRQV